MCAWVSSCGLLPSYRLVSIVAIGFRQGVAYSCSSSLSFPGILDSYLSRRELTSLARSAYRHDSESNSRRVEEDLASGQVSDLSIAYPPQW